MSPATILLVTFGVWSLVKGTAAQYWALATTKATGASNPSTSGIGSSTGLNPLPSPTVPVVPTVPAVPNVIGNSLT